MAHEQTGMKSPKIGPGAIRQAWHAFRSGNRSRGMERQDLASAIRELQRVNRSTEADFLAVTEKLGGFLAAARTVSSEIGAISRSIAGEGQNNSHALTDVMRHAREMEKRANTAGEFSSLRERAVRIRRGIAGFEQAVPAFRVMAVLAQIETARLGSAGIDLGHLADEIRSWSDHIRSRVDHILAGAGILEQKIEFALRDAAEFDRKSLKALPALIASVESSLNEFESRRRQSAGTAANLARQFDSLSRAISDIVTSIQSHDITRQQVEHVIESLKAPGDSLPAPRVIDLQVAQLENASRSFSAAIQQMDGRLGTVARQVQAMSAESGEFLGGAGQREDPFFAQMENSFRTIAETITGCSALEERTGAALVEVQQTIERVRISIEEIHAVEVQLRRLALNAGISAAHIGAAGEPLEVVAASMQQLQTACEASARETDAAVQSIATAMDSIATASNNAGKNTGDEVVRKLRSGIDVLYASNADAIAKYGGIIALASDLAQDIQALRSGISAGEKFTAAVARSCLLLRGIRAAAEWEHGAAGDAQLHKLRQLYTMNAEREIHQKLTGGAPETTPPSETGGNVEFF